MTKGESDSRFCSQRLQKSMTGRELDDNVMDVVLNSTARRGSASDSPLIRHRSRPVRKFPSNQWR